MRDLVKDLVAPIRDYTPNTPPSTIKDFIDGSLHNDFIKELSIRIESMRDYNEECDSKSYLETRGGIKALRLVSGIFLDLLNNAETKSKGE